MAKFEELLGKTITQIVGAEKDSEEIIFHCSDGSEYKMYHEQDCCESVLVEDVAGDIKSLLNNQLTMADESSNSEDESAECESCTWTYYKLATVKGYVTIRWFGTSNGYYSESVDFKKVRG